MYEQRNFQLPSKTKPVVVLMLTCQSLAGKTRSRRSRLAQTSKLFSPFTQANSLLSSLPSLKSINNSYNPANLHTQTHYFNSSSKKKMATSTMKTSFIAITLAGMVAGMVKAQCGNTCLVTECCSRFGFCGTGDDFCGVNCRGGPCVNNGVSIADIVTQEFFDGILNQAPSTCVGRSFYSRGVFLDALNSFTQFARTGSVEDSRREIAAFFAHVTHETGSKHLFLPIIF